MTMLLLSMVGSLKASLPQSGFVQQVIQKDKKQLVFAPSSLILANNYLPLSKALAVPSGFESLSKSSLVC